MSGRTDTLWALEEHSKGKHHILRRYVQAWLPIMMLHNPRVVLVDGFAGPGCYLGGEEGSPLILLNAYLTHSFRERMTGEVVYLFIEERADRVKRLRSEVDALDRPQNVKLHIRHGTYQEIFGPLLEEIQLLRHGLAPTFAFIDPFGYSQASMDITGQFLQFKRCEVLVYLPLPFVARFVDRDGQEQALTSLFGTSRWTEAIRLAGSDRLNFLHDLFRDQLRQSGCTYVRSFQIQAGASHGYHLFFGTTSLLGLEKMKEAMWSLDPLTGQRFSDSTNTDQLVLFEPKVDTSPLLKGLKDHFRSSCFSIEDAERYTLIETPFAKVHLKTRTLAPAERAGDLLVLSERRRRFTYPTGTVLSFADR